MLVVVVVVLLLLLLLLMVMMMLMMLVVFVLGVVPRAARHHAVPRLMQLHVDVLRRLLPSYSHCTSVHQQQQAAHRLLRRRMGSLACFLLVYLPR